MWRGKRAGAAGLTLLLAGCAEEAAPPPDLAGACAAAVAAHVGRPVADLTIRPAGTAPDGSTLFDVTDAAQGADRTADRTHVCEIDEGGRVRALRHP